MKSLKAIRLSQGVSLRKLGEQAGVSYVTIARIEAGIYDPRLSTLRKVASALKVTVAQVIGDQPFNQKGGSHGTDQTKGRVVRRVSRRG